MTDEDLNRQRIEEWISKPFQPVVHAYLATPNGRSRQLIALEPNGRYIADCRLKITEIAVLPKFRLSHTVGSVLNPGDQLWVEPSH